MMSNCCLEIFEILSNFQPICWHNWFNLINVVIKQNCYLIFYNYIFIFSDGWCKAGHHDFGAQQNNDQRFHMDYGNNTFLHPTPWYQPENVAAIAYLADTGTSS